MPALRPRAAVASRCGSADVAGVRVEGCAPTGAAWQALRVDAEDLVDEWLTLPDVAERTGLPVSKVRELVRQGRLVALRRGENHVLQVPAAFVAGNDLVKGLTGTLTLLSDAGYSPEESLRWLFTADDSLPGRPIDALSENRGGEVKRRAQAMAF